MLFFWSRMFNTGVCIQQTAGHQGLTTSGWPRVARHSILTVRARFSIALAVVSETNFTATQRDARNDMQKHIIKWMNYVFIALAVVSETLRTTTQRGARNNMHKQSVKCIISSGLGFVQPLVASRWWPAAGGGGQTKWPSHWCWPDPHLIGQVGARSELSMSQFFNQPKKAQKWKQNQI